MAEGHSPKRIRREARDRLRPVAGDGVVRVAVELEERQVAARLQRDLAVHVELPDARGEIDAALRAAPPRDQIEPQLGRACDELGARRARDFADLVGVAEGARRRRRVELRPRLRRALEERHAVEIPAALLPRQVELEQGRVMGALLGQMHALKLEFAALPQPEWEHFRVDDWDLLTVHAYDAGISWATPIRAVMHKLIEWSKLYEQAGEQLSGTYVVSHRDMDQKNVIWQDERTPRLIDWEAAGLVNPTMELVSVALDWSGLATGVVREDISSAGMESYVQSGGMVRDAGIDAIYGVMGIWLSWLVFNMRRSLGESVFNEEERQVGIRETPLALARLSTLAHYAETWASWIDRWRGQE